MLLSLLKFAAGLPLLIAGAELLVRGASTLARAVGVSSLVVGLTIVAYGTSAPELAVTLQAALSGRAELGVGNVVGSNITNVLLVLGMSAAISPLVVSMHVVRYNIPFMILVSILPFLLGADGSISPLEGIMLLLTAALYTLVMVFRSRSASRLAHKLGHTEPPPKMSGVEIGWRLAQIMLGLMGLTLGARWLVDSSTHFARELGVSELIIGLTIVAVGTSLPEIATSVLAAVRGERELAVGNAIGSNIFNILVVLGMSASVTAGGMPIGQQILRFDLPIMLAVAIAALPIFALGHKLARWEGILFVGYFAAYIGALLLRANNGIPNRQIDLWALVFVLPLLIVTISVIMFRMEKRWAAVAVAKD